MSESANGFTESINGHRKVEREDAQEFCDKAKYRFTIIFPEGRPLGGWANLINVLGDCHFVALDVLLELPHVVEGIRLGIQYVKHSEFHVVGGMVTYFPIVRGRAKC